MVSESTISYDELSYDGISYDGISYDRISYDKILYDEISSTRYRRIKVRTLCSEQPDKIRGLQVDKYK